MTSLRTMAEAFFAECVDILVDKARMRGVGNLIEQGPHGVINRVIDDKLMRLRSFADLHQIGAILRRRGYGERLVSAAGVEVETRVCEIPVDDMHDVANYMLLASLLARNQLSVGMTIEDRIGQSVAPSATPTWYRTTDEYPPEECVLVGWWSTGVRDEGYLCLFEFSPAHGYRRISLYREAHAFSTAMAGPHGAYDTDPEYWIDVGISHALMQGPPPTK